MNDTCYPWEDYVETQLDSRVGLAILVICIITLLADLVFFGLILPDTQLRHQVMSCQTGSTILQRI